MKPFTQRNMMVLDLIVSGTYGLLLWIAPVEKTLLISFLIIHIYTTFILQNRQKSNWLLVVNNSICGLVICLLPYGVELLKNQLIEPIFKASKELLLYLGCSSLGEVARINDIDVDNPQMLALLIVTMSISLFTFLWFVIYPIAEYVRQWCKKEIISSKTVDSNTIFYILYLFVVSILLLVESNIKVLMVGSSNLFLFFVALFPLLLYLKGQKRIAPLLKYYFAILAIIYLSYAIGGVLDYKLSSIGIIILSQLFYYVVCKCRGEKMQYRDIVTLLLASVTFVIARQGCGWVRVMFLIISAVSYACAVYPLFKNRKVLGVLLYMLMAFILPTLTLGYNQYRVIDARTIFKYNENQYPFKDLLLTYNPSTEKRGLRDRYGEVIPCKYDVIISIGSYSYPFVKVRSENLWGIYDIENKKLIVEPQYLKIEKHSPDNYKLTSKDGTVSYFNIDAYHYPSWDEEVL